MGRKQRRALERRLKSQGIPVEDYLSLLGQHSDKAVATRQSYDDAIADLRTIKDRLKAVLDGSR